MSDTLSHRSLRFKFSLTAPLTTLHPPALLSQLSSLFRRAGYPLAMGKEKRPKPLLQLAYPLPLGLEGLEEWADITLESGITETLDIVAQKLRQQCPDGLRILKIEQIPHYASPVAELCATAHWRWLCPEQYSRVAIKKTHDFANSETFQITKTGKTEGRKTTKEIEVRHLVQEMHWEDNAFHFTMAIHQGQALNPQKLLSALIGITPEELGTLQRLRISLKPDPRLHRTHKYAHKLKNLYEDAVLLETAPNLRVFADDDDELLVSN